LGVKEWTVEAAEGSFHGPHTLKIWFTVPQVLHCLEFPAPGGRPGG
jgi:hypothetical protein